MDTQVYRFRTDYHTMSNLQKELGKVNPAFSNWSAANETIFGALLPQLGVYLTMVQEKAKLKLLPDTAILLIPPEIQPRFQTLLDMYTIWFTLETDIDEILMGFLYEMYSPELVEKLQSAVDRRIRYLQDRLGEDLFQRKFLKALGVLESTGQTLKINEINLNEEE